MGQNEDNNEVYNNLTESVDGKSSGSGSGKWTLYLMLCCLTAAQSSLIFGFNIGATNLPTPLIKDFYARRYYPEFFVKNEEYLRKEQTYKSGVESVSQSRIDLENARNASNQSLVDEITNKINQANEESINRTNLTVEQFLAESRKSLDKARDDLGDAKSKLDSFTTLLWTVTASIFVAGGAIGAFVSKYILDYFGRKKGILFNNFFAIVASVLVFIAPYVQSPECVIASRFVFGFHGGAVCGLIPTYLAEISPSSLRGATGVLHQLNLTVGILIGQILGFRQVLGTLTCWHYLLATPIIPAVFSSLALLLFFPETPKALLSKNRDEESARKALHRLRNTTNVSGEIEQFKQETRDSKSEQAMSLKELFTTKELRWPLFTGLVLQLGQQLSGINAIFFYSEGIFRNATIKDEHIQYAVLATGVINVLFTIVVVPLIDRLGRKPLLVYPMFIMIVDFIVLTVFLFMQSSGVIYSYLSIVCIIVFIMCFAVGLGPIPFLYVAEVFRQDARGAALAVCMFVNWAANLLLALTFPYLASVLKNYVFLVFLVIVLISVLVILRKVPETKGRDIEEIMAYFEGKKPKYDESSGKLMAKTSNV